MNKSITYLVVLLFFCLNSSRAQTDVRTVRMADIQTKKEQGKLTHEDYYINYQANPNPTKIAPNHTNTITSTNGCNCFLPRDASWQVVQFDGSGGNGGPGSAPDYRNDDWSTVPLTLPFNFCFYGANITNDVYINNNGNVSFGGAYSTFTADSFPSNQYVMIAPFWGDVDTRGLASGIVYYQMTATHLIVQWENVGYYNIHDDKFNTFQLILTDGSDLLLPPNANVSFCYKDMSWTTGDASGGTNGFGGTASTVGVNQGNGTDYIQIGRYDKAGNSYDGPFGSADGVDMLDNQSFVLNACQSGSNVPPILNSVQVCDTLTVCQGDTLLISGTFLSPEANQITTCTVASLMTGLSVVSNIPGNTADFTVQIIGLASNLGMNAFDLIGRDNGSPVRSIRVPVIVNVIPSPIGSYSTSPAGIVNIGTPITFTNTTTGVVAGVTYLWDFGDGATSNAISPVHSYSVGGTYNVVLTITNPGGCVSTVTQQVNVFTCAVAGLSVTNECVGAPSTVTFTGIAIATSTFSWNFNGGTVISGAGIGPYQVSWATDGVYQVDVSVDITGCPTSTASQNVTIYGIPIASISSTAAVCVGQQAPMLYNGYSPAGTNITWDFAGGIGGGIGVGPFNISWNTAGNYVVQTIANNNGCADTAYANVIVNPIPTSTFAATPAVCAGANVSVTYNGNASAAANYSWNFNGATIISGAGQGPYSLSWNTPGTYQLSLDVSENGCISSQSLQSVTVNQIPIASITAMPVLCVGAVNTISFNGVAGPTAVYNWSFGNGAINSGSGVGPYQVQWNVAGNDQVTVSVTDNGCVSNAAINVSATPIPNSIFTATPNVCAGNNVSVTYTGNATAGANYLWDFNGGTSSGNGQGPFNVVWASAGNYNLSLSVSENGCTSNATNVPVVVNAIPIASILAATQLCVGDQNTVSFNGTAIPSANYSWNFGTATVNSGSGSGPYNVQWSTSGNQSITLTVTQNGCSDQTTFNLLVNPIPTSLFVLPTSVCENAPFIATYNGSASGSANFNWNFGAANVVSGMGVGPYSLTSAAGNQAIGLTVTENGCVSPLTTQNINVVPAPIIDAGIDQSVCSGTIVQAGSIAEANTVYSWAPVSGIDNPSSSQVNITMVNPSVGTTQTNYILTAVNSIGCLSKDTVQMNAKAIPSAEFADQLPQCLEGNSFTFLPFGTLFPGVDYTWSFGASSNIVSSNLQNPPPIVYNSVGVFPVNLSYTYDGCPGQPYLSSVEVLAMPNAEFMPTVLKGCSPLEVPFGNTSSANSNFFHWSFSDGQSDTLPFPIHHFTVPGTYSVTLTVTTTSGCSSDTTLPKIIEVYPNPIAAFTPDPDIATIYEPIIHFDNHTVNGAYYNWDFGDSSVMSQLTSPYHSYDEVGFYDITLMVESDHGCRDTVRGIVRIEYGFSFFVPSAFTPNGDGVNDYFQGYGTFIKEYELTIYDRWGILVYKTTDYSKPWDGKVKNEVQNDIYVYKIKVTDLKNNQHSYIGKVSVIK